MNKEEKLCKLFFECKREGERERVNRQARKKRLL